MGFEEAMYCHSYIGIVLLKNYCNHMIYHVIYAIVELDCTSWFTLADAFSRRAQIRDKMQSSLEGVLKKKKITNITESL